MKKLLFAFLILCFSYKSAIATNNIFGVHILFPEEVKEAAELVNSNGGDWGYVVIPIQSVDRNHDKWQLFMGDCKKYHLVPIIRLATYPVGSNWAKPNDHDSIDWANFLNDLDWPTKQKIVAVYNEPNHAEEWGGEVNPFEYANVLGDTIEQFKKRDKDFFMLNAGLDASSANTGDAMDEYEFMSEMMLENPDIFRKIDGFNAHSYPNPAFSSSPDFDSRFGINSYQYEINFLQDLYGIYGLKVFITETGWKKNDYLPREKIAEYLKTAFLEIWTEEYIQLVAPFLLKADAGGFENFSLISKNEKSVVYNSIREIKKTKGAPSLEKNIKVKQIDPKFDKEILTNYKKQKTEEPIKFKDLWKKIIWWVLK